MHEIFNRISTAKVFARFVTLYFDYIGAAYAIWIAQNFKYAALILFFLRAAYNNYLIAFLKHEFLLSVCPIVIPSRRAALISS